MSALCAIPALCDAQSQSQSENHSPFTFEASYVGDAYHNAAGGLARGGGFMGMGNITVGFDTEAARLWKGGTFFINGASIHGHSLTENYLGDLQVASNIDAGEHAYLHELWFRQKFGPVSLTIGLQDLNAEFMVSEGGGAFVNSSFGTPSVVALGIPVPIFPLTGPGVTARWDISERWAVQGALFDGVQTDFDHNPHNTNWSLGRGDGTLTMGELHLDGRYKLGAYYHSQEDNWGVYMSANQPVSDRVGVFMQAVVSPRAKNDNSHYFGLGANVAGVFSRRHRDAAGLAIAHAGLHRASHKHETAVELYYKYQLTENIALQPDIQWVINPSGCDVRLENALVGILRLHLCF